MSKINFTAGTALSRSLKQTPAKFRTSAGRPNISMSPGVRPAIPLMPMKELPTSFQDESTTDYVVIPKGRIVSAITGNNNSEILGDGNSVYTGCPKGIMGLIVPANGGVARTIVSAVDGETEVVLPANYPIGVAEHDVYQDIRGENLNYQMLNNSWGVLSRYYIKLPALDIALFSEMMGDADCFLPANDDETGTEAEYVHTVTATEAAGVATTYEHVITNAEALAGVAIEVDIATIDANAADKSFVFASATTVNGGGGEVYTISFDGSVVTITSDGVYTEDATITISFDAYANIEIALATIAAELGIQPEQYSYVFVEATVVADGGGETVVAAYANEVLTLSSDGLYTEDATITITVTYTDLNTDAVAPTDATDVSAYAYAEATKKYAFYTFNSERNEGLSGTLLKPDFYGNWMPATSISEQVVGRLFTVDYRFPKDLLDTAQNAYEEDPSHRVAGTGTMGIPQFLYDFAYTVMDKALTIGGTTWDAKWPGIDPAKKVREVIRGGAIGEAWIQLNI